MSIISDSFKTDTNQNDTHEKLFCAGGQIDTSAIIYCATTAIVADRGSPVRITRRPWKNSLKGRK